MGKNSALVKKAEAAYYNAMMSKNFWVSMDAEKHFHALNTLIIGASGTGKTRFWLKPNLLQMNTSYIITDPKGEILDSCGELLRRNGYDVKVFDVAFDANKVHRCNTYNPLKYCKQESDIRKVVEAFITNSKPPGQQSGGSQDQFWDDSMKTLMLAIIGLLCQVPEGSDVPYGQIEEVTGGEKFLPCFSNVIELVRKSEKRYSAKTSGIELMEGVVMEDSKNATAAGSELGAMFENLRMWEANRQDCEVYEIEKPYCLQEWEGIYKTTEKTFSTIKTTAATRLDPFNIQQIRDITSTDTICLDEMAFKKTAVFLIMKAADKTYNFLLSLLYTQLFDQLYGAGEARVDKSQYVSLPNGECVRWFSREELSENPSAAADFQDALKSCSYRKVHPDGTPYADGESGEVLHGKYKGKPVSFEDAYYEVVLPNGEHVTNRVTEEMARDFVDSAALAKVKKGVTPKLPFHFRFLIDEFPNIGEIPEFKEKLSTMRGYNISATVICQTITQLKGMYEKDYEVIDANCPFVVFLGGDENSNNEYLAKKMGKTTVRNTDQSVNEKEAVNTQGKTDGAELMTQDELGRIPFNSCLVFVYGEQPLFDKKFDVVDHKNFSLSKEYMSKSGINAMNFDFSNYEIEHNAMVSWRGSEAVAIPNVTFSNPAELKTALLKHLGAPSLSEGVKKADANMKRYTFEEASVPIPL